jgi:hypothetical protein
LGVPGFQPGPPCRFFQFVEIPHKNTQAERWSNFGVAGGELFFVVIQVEVKGIAGIHIDEIHVRVGHQQLSEGKAISAIGHVISGLQVFCRPIFTKNQQDVLALDMNGGYFALHMRRRKDRRGIKDQIILAGFHAEGLCRFL